MLFNSYPFIFVFLPTTLFIFFTLGKYAGHKASIGWLIVASLVFYGWWNPAYVAIIVGLMVLNFSFGLALTHLREDQRARNIVLTAGIVCNLLFLTYFKFFNFFVASINTAFHTSVHAHEVLLPLGISFFIFQKIAYLVDTSKGEIKEHNFFYYSLFVLFFPQLIAGPIVHYKEIAPQLKRIDKSTFNNLHFSVGITIFIIGLFKKVFIADQIAQIATPIFTHAAQGYPLTFFEAWSGALAYTFQIYFDFSGYSDMAIGLARMFGIRLPINFYSPYKATNIIDFWRRWHITLSRFLRDYVYIPLGGNRKGKHRRYLNLLFTMLLGGLWHGAGWTFVLWGLVHGVYLVINHAWDALRQRMRRAESLTQQNRRRAESSTWQTMERTASSAIGIWVGRVITFFAVVAAWVLFRSAHLRACKEMFKGMLGINGIVLWESYKVPLNKIAGLGNRLEAMGWQFGNMDFFQVKGFVGIIILWVIVWSMPNTQQIMAKYRPSLTVYWDNTTDRITRWWQWRPTLVWALIIAVVAVVTISGYMSQVSEFLYFRF